MLDSRSRLVVLALGLTGVTTLAACDELAPVPAGTCGNLVVESGEQCDGQPRCATSGAAACRYTCEPGLTACPGALACAADGVCVVSAERFVPYELARRYELPADRIVIGDLDGDRRDDVIGVGESLRVRFGAAVDPLLASFEKQIRPPTGAAAFGELDDQPGLDVIVPTADGVFTLLARGRSLEAVPYASAAALPDDGATWCDPSPGWAACRLADLDRDGRVDRVGFVADRDNLRLELARASGPAVAVTLDTLDVITDLATGDFDGDGFGDVAFATRPVDGTGGARVAVAFGAPQPAAFAVVAVTRADEVRGLAAADTDAPADGLDDLAVDRRAGAADGVALHLGDPSRDLSAPFRLDGGPRGLDVPYGLVAGEFVGGAGSGVDVMAYARNPADPGSSYFWWLRGLGGAQLEVGAIDPVEVATLDFLDGQWQVADLVEDPSTGNGPDEVVGLSSRVARCPGPALTVAVPSARFTPTDLLRSACLDGAEADGWAPASVGLVRGAADERAVILARRDRTWWLGEAERLDEATAAGRLAGDTVELPADCRDPQLWPQTPDVATFVSWVCDDPLGSTVVVLDRPRGGAITTASLGVAPRGATHHAGDVNGDGLTDVIVRAGDELAVMLQCSTDMIDRVPGC